jgi:hypothetical protein
MNKYGIGHFIYFLALTLITHFIFRANDWLGQTLLLLYLPVIFGLFYFAKFLKFTFKEDNVRAKLSIGIFLNYLFITLKLDYTYYNFLACFLVILINGLIVFKLKNIVRTKLGTISVLTLSLISILLITPDTLIFKFINRSDNNVSWSQNIKWNYFKGEIDKNPDEWAARIYSSTVWRINKAYNYPPAVSIAKMDMKKSWSVKKHQNDYLLNHEQGHFNVTEIHRRLAMDSIKSLDLIKSHDIDSIIFYFASKKAELQKVYDKESDHGVITESQKKWDKLISNKLDSLNH